MTVVIPKNASKEEIKKNLQKLEKRKTALKSKKRKGKSASLFGSNPNEADGLAFQKKVRAEWKN
jgi:hypothetical protein